MNISDFMTPNWGPVPEGGGEGGGHNLDQEDRLSFEQYFPGFCPYSFVFLFFSVGLENVEDLKKDLEQALEKV